VWAWVEIKRAVLFSDDLTQPDQEQHRGWSTRLPVSWSRFQEGWPKERTASGCRCGLPCDPPSSCGESNHSFGFFMWDFALTEKFFPQLLWNSPRSDNCHNGTSPSCLRLLRPRCRWRNDPPGHRLLGGRSRLGSASPFSLGKARGVDPPPRGHPVRLATKRMWHASRNSRCGISHVTNTPKETAPGGLSWGPSK